MTWDGARREARRTESELSKQMRFLRDIEIRAARRASGAKSENDSVYDVESASFDNESIVCGEIETLLEQLAKILDAMATHAMEGASRRQQLQRYREVHHEFKSEFSSLRGTLLERRQKAELLGTAR